MRANSARAEHIAFYFPVIRLWHLAAPNIFPPAFSRTSGHSLVHIWQGMDFIV